MCWDTMSLIFDFTLTNKSKPGRKGTFCQKQVNILEVRPENRRFSGARNRARDRGTKKETAVYIYILYRTRLHAVHVKETYCALQTVTVSVQLKVEAALSLRCLFI